MPPTDPGRFINAATAKNPAVPHIFLPSAGGQARMPDKVVSRVPLATSPRPSGKVDSPRAEPLRNLRSRPFDPFDDPCNYLG